MLNQRTLQDLNLQVVTALPAAAANVTSASIDTTGVTPGRIPDVEMYISVPPTPSLTDTDAITFTWMDSADNATFAAMADVPTYTITGAGGVGGAAALFPGAPLCQIKIPVGARRYVALKAAVANGGGNNTAVSYTWGFVF